MAAAIESALGIGVELVEGHDGIYRVAVDEEIVFSSDRACIEGFPDEGMVVERIGQIVGKEPKRPSP